jgi:CitMHS family citrate-Mg2+:H+ or citrate-Ca2+:H+ symporter
VSLDGDGSTTFIVVTAAMLPIYQRLEMSPVVLTCVAGLINGTLNIVPVGRTDGASLLGAADRRQRHLRPMVPSLIAGLLVCLVFAYLLGISERRRLAKNGVAWVEDRGANPVAGPRRRRGRKRTTGRARPQPRRPARGTARIRGSAASANDGAATEATRRSGGRRWQHRHPGRTPARACRTPRWIRTGRPCGRSCSGSTWP